MKPNHKNDRMTRAAKVTPEAAGETMMASFSIGQSLAEDGIRFWARRLHTYADWAAAAATCRTPDQFIDAQTRFITRTQSDYTEGTAALVQRMNARVADAAMATQRPAE